MGTFYVYSGVRVQGGIGVIAGSDGSRLMADDQLPPCAHLGTMSLPALPPPLHVIKRRVRPLVDTPW